MNKAFHIWLFTLLLFACNLNAQTDSSYFTPAMFERQINELRTHYGQEKIIPQEYELQVLTALSHYPELKGVRIEFITFPINSTMMAQPNSKNMYNRKKRSYIVFINNCRENTGFLPSELTFNQFVGVMGHELAHISYYSGRTALDLMIDGIGYYFKSYRRDFEAGTDMLTLDHGLGWQLLDFTDYIMNKAKLSEQYEKKKQRIYLTEKDIYRELLKRKQEGTQHKDQ